MFENLDFSKMGELLKSFEEKSKQFEKELETKEFTAKSGAGLVSASVNGKAELIDLQIDNSLLEDKESLQILLISAINDAISMAIQNRNKLSNILDFQFKGDTK